MTNYDLQNVLALFSETNDDALKGYLGKAVRRMAVLLTKPVSPSPEPDRTDYSELSAAEIKQVKNGRKIAAIKLYRKRTGLGLRDAKMAVEYLGYPEENYPVPEFPPFT